MAEIQISRGIWSNESAHRHLMEEAAGAVLRHRIGTPAERLARFRGYVEGESWELARLALGGLEANDTPGGRDLLVRSLLLSAKSLSSSRSSALALQALDLAEDVGGRGTELSRGRFETLITSGRVDEALVASERAIEHALGLGSAGRGLVEDLGGWRFRVFIGRRDLERARESLALLAGASATAIESPALDRYIEVLAAAATEEYRRSGSPEASQVRGIALIAGYRSALRGKPLDEASVVTAVALVATTELVDRAAFWNYLDDGSDPGAAWHRPDFDDSGWREGPAPLGFGDGREAARLRQRVEDAQPLAYYFRHRFECGTLRPERRLVLKLARDDGAAVYLNGNEVVRDNLPADGSLDASTLATATTGGADEAEFREFPASSVPSAPRGERDRRRGAPGRRDKFRSPLRGEPPSRASRRLLVPWRSRRGGARGRDPRGRRAPSRLPRGRLEHGAPLRVARVRDFGSGRRRPDERRERAAGTAGNPGDAPGVPLSAGRQAGRVKVLGRLSPSLPAPRAKAGDPRAAATARHLVRTRRGGGSIVFVVVRAGP